MPRSFSSAIQSEVAWRAALRLFTEPAIWIAPPNSSSFSVSVVLPASGWLMMANVRRRRVSSVWFIADVFRAPGREAQRLRRRRFAAQAMPGANGWGKAACDYTGRRSLGSALDHVDGEAATAGFLVLVLHVAAGVAHGRRRRAGAMR